MSIRPLFILSLPRTGSTLLQRLLCSHPAISSVAEPWILLPLLHGTRSRRVATAYDQHVLTQAVSEFCQELPNGADDFDDAVRGFALGLYEKVAEDGSVFFLDKTPAYCLIARDLLRVFPDARFLVLWRNPLSQIASVVKLYGRGRNRWAIRVQDAQQHEGVDQLIAVATGGDPRVQTLRYEDLVHSPETVLRGIFEHLDLDFDETILSSFVGVEFKGRIGDPTGVKEYSAVSVGSLDKWKGSMSSLVRQRWMKRYLRWLGTERLEIMGYSLEEMQKELARVPVQLWSTMRDIGPMIKEESALRLKRVVLAHR